MIHKGFKMKLYDGMAEEYEKRHNELWPEMKDMIHEHGGKNYSLTKKQWFFTVISKSKMKNFGQRVPIPPSIENGGTLWLTLWKQILITVLFQKIYTLYSIWIDKMCIN